MTRQEHMDWSKRRALACLMETGNVHDAFSSMASDLQKHKETEDHLALQFGMVLLVNGHLNTVEKMREFIEGFN